MPVKDVRMSRSGDELLSLWSCLDDSNLGKAILVRLSQPSPALSRATCNRRRYVVILTKETRS
jgi:hypothetical protein